MQMCVCKNDEMMQATPRVKRILEEMKLLYLIIVE